MHFEDYQIGATYLLPPLRFSREEIKDFAEKYDPRPFHLDETLASRTPFGDLIASGFHTICAFWAEWVRMGIDDENLIAGMQIRSARWLAPVYPDETLHATVTISDKRLFSNRKAGEVFDRLTVEKEDGTPVLEFESSAKVLCRPQ